MLRLKLAKRFFSSKKTAPEILYTGIFVNNEWKQSVGGETFDTVNPSNEQVIARVAKANAEDVNLAVEAANDAFKMGSPWRRMDGAERGRLINKFADLMERDAQYLASLESLDNGKPISLSQNLDVPACIGVLRYYAGYTDKIHGHTIPTPGDFQAYTVREPVGVCGQIIPWNFPMLMFTMKVASALTTGNTIVIKPAEQTPLTALYLAQLAKEAGIPAGVLNVVPGLGDAGEAIVRHPKVDKISFTGSTEVGLKIQQQSGVGRLKRTTLELGGKSPNIVLDDVDIANAVEHAHQALFLNQGQVCTSASRCFVQEQIYDEFVERSAERAKRRVLGDPFDERTEQGPQVSRGQMEKILGLVKSGVQDGASLVTGGQRDGDKGYFVQPTVFANVQDHHKIAVEEIFGPVQQLIKFKNLEEVIERANNTRYGLAAAVFSRDVDKINYLTRGIRAGTIWVNCYNAIFPSVPFGGFKDSGVGRENALEGLHHYTEVKSIITALPQKMA